jgi:predicted amidohydrolase YtcJ
MKGETVDLIIHNANIHTMLDNDKKATAIAIKDGKIVEVGPERQILNKYSADEYIDVEQKDVFPGWVDAHGHILNYARQMISVDLVGCKSYDEMLVRIEKYQSKHNRPFIIGRGWDQSLWGDEMPTNDKLNEVFPDIPVCLFRIDGHALLANDYLIQKSDVVNKFHADPELNQGGFYESETEMTDFVHGKHISSYRPIQKPTGVFVDNAMNPILDVLTDFPEKELKEAILEVQNELYVYGITGVHEAGLTRDEVKLLEKMIDSGDLTLNIYGMLLPTKENIAFAKKHGPYTHDNLYIRSFKVYGDGALGSRGACLKKAYTDMHHHFGYLTTSIERMKEYARLCEEVGYQMNTHAIGDSTNKVVLDIYKSIYLHVPDHRWRIEHAQVVDPADYMKFAEAGVFPSIQPTHATSDQRWAESRLGEGQLWNGRNWNRFPSRIH